MTDATKKQEPINAYLVKIVERAHSSGAEHWYERTFLSLKGASDYLKEYLEGLKADYNYPEEVDYEGLVPAVNVNFAIGFPDDAIPDWAQADDS